MERGDWPTGASPEIGVTMAEGLASDENASLVAALFDQYRSAIFAYAWRLVGDREWAEELTQETFLRVFNAREQLPRVINRRAWVYRIGTNVCLNAIKRRRRFAWLPWPIGHIPTLEESDAAEQIVRRDALELALAALPPEYRAPLLLYTHYGFAVCEVAEALAISEGAVKTRIYRAREMFRKAYERENRK
jgi:RNA polymerase sigma-70 factor, ECF subfamily